MKTESTLFNEKGIIKIPISLYPIFPTSQISLFDVQYTKGEVSNFSYAEKH